MVKKHNKYDWMIWTPHLKFCSQISGKAFFWFCSSFLYFVLFKFTKWWWHWNICWLIVETLFLPMATMITNANTARPDVSTIANIIATPPIETHFLHLCLLPLQTYPKYQGRSKVLLRVSLLLWNNTPKVCFLFREGVKKIFNYLAGIFHGQGGGTHHPYKWLKFPPHKIRKNKNPTKLF